VELIHVKVEKEAHEKLERLVKARIYKNKSEAVRDMLNEHMEEHPELFANDDIAELLKDADSMSDVEFEERMAAGLKGRKSAAKIVSEGRGHR